MNGLHENLTFQTAFKTIYSYKFSNRLLVFSYQQPNKEYLITELKLYPHLRYQLISEHFGENRTTIPHGCKMLVH